MKPKDNQEIENIRTSGRILAEVLSWITKELKPGINGVQIDLKAREILKKYDAKPAFLGVRASRGVPNFPATICISVNDAVVHGIPNRKPFEEGDIVGFDFGVSYKGMITDSAITLIVGTPKKPQHLELVKTTRLSLERAISIVKPGIKTGDIGQTVQEILESKNLGVVRELVGHGVGHELHEEPEIPNYGVKGTGFMLKEGMTIAIEPMATIGDWRVVVDPDGWTIRSRDGSVAAHFEDTILVTKDGCEILTR